MSPYQIVCEGKADQVFFSRLLEDTGKSIDVACPRKEDVDGGLGKTAIHKRLIGLQSEFAVLARVVVIVDSDDDPQKAFNDACGEFEKANTANPKKQYPIPIRPDALRTTEGAPSTAIILIPDTAEEGCLDSLLLSSFEEKYPQNLRCVNEFCHCINAAQNGTTREAKVRLRSIIAATQRSNPGISLSLLLEEKNCPVDLGHNSFERIKNSLLQLFP